MLPITKPANICFTQINIKTRLAKTCTMSKRICIQNHKHSTFVTYFWNTSLHLFPLFILCCEDCCKCNHIFLFYCFKRSYLMRISSTVTVECFWYPMSLLSNIVVFLRCESRETYHIRIWMTTGDIRGRLTKTNDVTIPRYRKSQRKITVGKMHILLSMGSKFCVKFLRAPLKFHTRFWTHTPQNMYFTRC